MLLHLDFQPSQPTFAPKKYSTLTHSQCDSPSVGPDLGPHRGTCQYIDVATSYPSPGLAGASSEGSGKKQWWDVLGCFLL